MAQLAAKKYAVALFELYKESKDEQVFEDAALVLEALKSEEGFKETLLHPRVTAEEKIVIVNNAFAGASSVILGFLNIVIKKNRENELIQMLNIFIELAEEFRGVVNAQVYTAFPLTEERINTIKQMLTQKMEKTVNIEVKEDASLIGGLCIKAGGFIYDASVKKQLEDMRLSLL